MITSPNGKSFSPPPSRCWSVNQEKYTELLVDGRIYFGKEGSSRPYLKTYLSEVQDGIVPTTIRSYNDAGHNIGAKSELRDLFLDTNMVPFDTPKPVKLIKRIMSLSGMKDNDLILDFFAGSGTTGHAVMELNAEDKGKRRYILVQLPEKIKETEEAYKAGYRTISQITRDRLIKAGEKIGGEGDRGFKFLSLSSSNFQALDPIVVSEATTTREQLFDRIALEFDASGLKQDRKELDIIYELLIRYGYSLHSQLVKDSPYIGRYTVRDDKIFERSFFITLVDTITDTIIQSFLKTYHEQKDTVFLCKDTAISDSHRITLAQYFSRFSTF